MQGPADSATRQAAVGEQQRRRVFFLLPGYSAKPVGGYKVAFEYANVLAHDPSLEVSVVSAAEFRMVGHGGKKTLRSRLGQVKSFVNSVRFGARVPWFNLDPRVVVRNSWSAPDITCRASDVFVATAAQTAPFAAQLAARAGTGVYFIQHWESWSVPEPFVETTWRLPLKRIVIAPWLQARAAERGLDSILVPNAINPQEFPRGGPIAERPRQVMALVSHEAFKRTDLIIEVFAELRRRQVDFTAVTFGTCSRPADLPTEVIHHQLPPKQQLTELYRSSRVYLCASDAEGWHLPPAEALFSGTSVVSTDIGGVRAYADEVALFSPTGDASALADNVERMLDDPALAQSLADAGFDRLSAYSPLDAATAFSDAALDRV